MKVTIILACLIVLAAAVEPEQDQEASESGSGYHGNPGGYSRLRGGYNHGGNYGRRYTPNRSYRSVQEPEQDQEASESGSGGQFSGNHGSRYGSGRGYGRSGYHGGYSGNNGYNTGRNYGRGRSTSYSGRNLY